MSSTIVVFVIVIFVAAIVVIANRESRRRQAERAEEYRKAALLRGWRMEPDGKQFRYSGMTEGVPWTLTTGWGGESEGEERHPSTFETNAVCSDDVVIAWPKEASAALQLNVPDAVRAVLFVPLARILGIDVHALATAKHDPAFSAALDDTKIIAAVLSPKGLRVIYPAVASDPEEVERLVRLGVKLARTQRPRGVL